MADEERELTPEELAQRRRRVVIIFIAVLIIILAFVVFTNMVKSTKGGDKAESVMMELTEGEEKELVDNNMMVHAEPQDGFVKENSAMDLWKRLSGEEPADDAQAAATSTGETSSDDLSALIAKRRAESEAAVETKAQAGAAPAGQTPPKVKANAAKVQPQGQGTSKKTSSKKADPQPQAIPEQPVDTVALAQTPPKDAGVFQRHEDADDGWNTGISSLDDSYSTAGVSDGPVKCTFLDSRTIQNGDKVVVRLLESVKVDGVTLPENTQLSAKAQLSGDRMVLSVTAFRLNGVMHTAALVSYDSDGARGIYCPSNNESIKSSTRNRAVNIGSSTLTGVLGSIAGQAVQTGVDAAQQALSKTSVSVNSGYVFYLVSEKR